METVYCLEESVQLFYKANGFDIGFAIGIAIGFAVGNGIGGGLRLDKL